MLNIPLLVKRTFSNGNVENVGKLAENSNGVYFQYDDNYLSTHKSSIAPFNLEFDNSLQKAPHQPHYGLHGVFGDSLPDGWGLYLMDRVFRQNGYVPQNITALERLAFIGNRGPGALSYEPEIQIGNRDKYLDIELITLGKEAIKEFEGTESHLIAHLMNAGGSGGARPKLNVTKLANGTFTTKQDAIGEKLIIKLTSEKFALGHHESLIEYTYMKIAERVNIEVADFELFDAGNGQYWLQQSRFDCVGEQGRFHMISACGLLDSPFREPSLDYIELIKATRMLCNTNEAKKLLYRAIFNYLMMNQDDHAKNFAFLADDNDNWRISPFYDIVYSPSRYNEHMTAFNGDGSKITKQTMELMAGQAGLPGAKAMMNIAAEIYDIAKDFHTAAEHVGIPAILAKEIQRNIDNRWNTLKE
ncbi:type II toxin-antitoxin system HipA family toxin [Photorhabdus tasmaniensis]|uniref:Phosphatidylinositol kinase n=1 Tax=Photorhabdus tasmaniensis TaxID=1004159 RepID=A0ABX0GJ55_9GAMM|nr:type II toxin-antitoxin system HipA family toxin [Photorhabdus tasmaniensis]NHB88395.1 phosphatidylinositol kinase [Photorhabdus tasmaniensis]